MAKSTFYTVVSEAIRDFAIHGFDSQDRLEHWMARLEAAMSDVFLPQHVVQRKLAEQLTRIFEKTVGRPGQIMRRHPGVSEFTIRQIAPRLRAELDRRILANVTLITLNRRRSREQALQRFAGWATSIPIGGSRAVDKTDEAEKVRRSIAGLSFVDRRATIDQGHKLVAAIHDIIGIDSGAIALIWRHVKEGPPAYDSRPDHVARDGKIFVIRDNWAMKAGFMKLDGRQYYDEVPAVAQEINCRCWAEYLTNLRDLPPAMLTVAGKNELARVRALIRAAA